MSAEVVTPTNLFVQVAFTGWSVPYGKAILWDRGEDRIYIQQELDNLGAFNLPFVLDRLADVPKSFELFVQYKGLESRRLLFEFTPGTYDPSTTVNLVLPPLVDTSQTEITTAQEVKLIAYACAGCEVTWTLAGVDTTTAENQAMTNEFGYSEVLVSKGLQEGAYLISAIAKKEEFQSEGSTELELIVRAGGSIAGGDQGVYAYGPRGIMIEGLSDFMASGWFRFTMLSAIGVLLAWLLRSSLEVIDLLHRMWGWAGPLIRTFIPRLRDRYIERYLRVYKSGSKTPFLEEHLHGKKEPFHLELPPGRYRLVWEEPNGQQTETELVVTKQAPRGKKAEAHVEIASTPPVVIKPNRDKHWLKNFLSARQPDQKAPKAPPPGAEATSPESLASEPPAEPASEVILDHQVYT